LYIALVVSAILLFVVNLIARKAEHPVAPILATAFLIGLVSAMICIFLPPVILQAALMCIAASIWGATVYRPWFFHLLSCAATLVAFGVPGYFAFRETRHLQEAFPYVSMDDRLPPPKPQRPDGDLPAATATRLDELESLIGERARRSDYRESSLHQIHEDAVRIFVNRPGFGVARMVGVSEARLKYEMPPEPQPGTPSASPWLPEELSREQPAESKTLDNLLSLHRGIFVDFVNFTGFGYIKDRQHVAGFQEHRISQTPTPERPWTLQTLDLVGLLLHEKPIAYVSKDLPRMKELRAAPTRELDDFETTGLLALQHGDDLFVRERGNERRMLGAIRAARLMSLLP
jgi:hypothetical protein